MLEKKKSVYEIYLWMGVVGKYTGCIPLPGVYEKREWSKWTKGVINYVIPTLNLSFLFYNLITPLYYYNGLYKPKNLMQWLFQLVYVSRYVHKFLCIVFNHFYLRRDLVIYLKVYSSVDELLRDKSRRLKRILNFIFVFWIALHTVKAELSWIITLGVTKYFHMYEEYATGMFTTILFQLVSCHMHSIAIHTHPYLTYIIFQSVLKSSFDQLLVKIKKNQNEELSCEMRVKKMRKYMRLYCDLCELCVQLDRMVSPLMLIQFLMYYLTEIYILALMISTAGFNVFALQDFASGFLVLFLVSNVAYLTNKSRDKILPVIYFTFNSDEKDMKTEVQNFSLQSMYFNKSFSASSIVKLDMTLILAIFQSLISQVVVFYKISMLS